MWKAQAAFSILKALRPILIGAVAVVMAFVFLLGGVMVTMAQAITGEQEPVRDGVVVVGTCAPDCPGADGPQQGFSVKQALAMAQSEIGQYFPTGYNQEGECIKSVQRWVNNSGGYFSMGGVVAGYTASPALRVTDGSLRPGDVIQYENLASPDIFLTGVHTYMVLAVNNDGTHDIIESNYNWDGQVGVRHNQTSTPPPGFQAVVWRFAAQPDT